MKLVAQRLIRRPDHFWRRITGNLQIVVMGMKLFHESGDGSRCAQGNPLGALQID
jgi:hypothetical protein